MVFNGEPAGVEPASNPTLPAPGAGWGLTTATG